jgi:hypothetical protein
MSRRTDTQGPIAGGKTPAEVYHSVDLRRQPLPAGQKPSLGFGMAHAADGSLGMKRQRRQRRWNGRQGARAECACKSTGMRTEEENADALSQPLLPMRAGSVTPCPAGVATLTRMSGSESRETARPSRRHDRRAVAAASPRWSLGLRRLDELLDLVGMGIFNDLLGALDWQSGVVNSAKATCDTIAADYHVVAG